MATRKEVKNRIASVKNVQQITRAMEMVAAARLRRAEQRIDALRPYATELRKMTRQVAEAAGVETDELNVLLAWLQRAGALEQLPDCSARGTVHVGLREPADLDERRRFREMSVLLKLRPEVSSRPASMMPIEVQKSASSVSMWEDTRMVFPILHSSRINSRISILACGSRPDAGSSSSRTAGSCSSVLARHNLCFMPRERLITWESRLPVRSVSSSTSSMALRRPARSIS